MKHKRFRNLRRNEWIRRKKYKLTDKRPNNHKKLKRYEGRKRRQAPKKIISSQIDLPKKINFEEDINNMVEITSDVNKYLKKWNGTKFAINHKKVTDITIGGLVYLVAQISKVAKACNIKLKYNEELSLRKYDERIRYLFYKVGYWDCFGITKPYKIQQEIKDNYFLSIQTNNISDISLLNKIKNFINKNVDFINDYSVEYKFDDAVKEAMANSIEHAYNKNFNEAGKVKGKWWICGHYDKINNSLELVFYDYGIGIRKSIKRNLGKEAEIVLFDKIKDVARNDADLIELAIKSKLTKYNNYKEHDRGKGFKRFQEFAKISKNNCEMTIVSEQGKYKYYYNGKNDTEEIEKYKLDGKIEGMLIKWKIQLNGEGKINDKI